MMDSIIRIVTQNKKVVLVVASEDINFSKKINEFKDKFQLQDLKLINNNEIYFNKYVLMLQMNLLNMFSCQLTFLQKKLIKAAPFNILKKFKLCL